MATPSATSSAAVETTPKVYDGPLGLTWGLSPSEVKDALQGKLTFVEEFADERAKLFSQRYKGSFGGITPEGIEVAFREKKLIAVIAQLQANDVRPASRRWLELVEATVAAHGAPGQLSEVPKAPKLSAVLSAYPDTPNAGKIRELGSLLDDMSEQSNAEMLDRRIERGDWTPSALWKFQNESGIGVSIVVGPADRYGHHPLTPTWVAYGSGFKAWLESVKSKSDL